MSQFQGFRGTVLNGFISVYSTLVGICSNPSGTPFTASETLTYTGGTGTFISWDASAGILRFFRASGVVPALGATITGSTSGASVDLDFWEAENLPSTAGSPANFDTSPEQGAIISGEQVAVQGYPGVIRTVGGTIVSDRFSMDSSWTAADAIDVPIVVHRDFTPTLALPIIDQFDGQYAGLTSRGFQTIDASFGGEAPIQVGAGGGAPAWENSWGNWTTQKMFFRKDPHGMVHLWGWAFKATLPGASQSIFTMPVGYRPGMTVLGHFVPPNIQEAAANPTFIQVWNIGSVVWTYDATTTPDSTYFPINLSYYGAA